MKTNSQASAVYRIESAPRCPRGARRVLEWHAFVMSEGKFEPADQIRNRTRQAPIPHGTGAVPDKDRINFIGEGSGFLASMPRLKVILKVRATDADRPFEDMWDGSHFRVGCWIVSARLKSLLLELDRDAFEFLPIETELMNGNQVGPEYWLCDLTRFLPATDEPLETVVASAWEERLRFKRDVIGDSQFFRDASLPSHWVFGTHSARERLDGAGMIGLSFEVWGHQA